MATVVFLNGDYEDAGYYRRWFEDGEHIVAADGGAAFLINRGITRTCCRGFRLAAGAAPRAGGARGGGDRALPEA